MKSHLPHVNSHRSLLVIIIIIILLTFPQRLQPAATHSKKKFLTFLQAVTVLFL